jgi:hypothetical protein
MKVMEEGYIPEELFDDLGFPEDVDMNGVVVPRGAGISCEPQQRAKVLSHKAQRLLRVERQKELDLLANENDYKRRKGERTYSKIILNAKGPVPCVERKL